MASLSSSELPVGVLLSTGAFLVFGSALAFVMLRSNSQTNKGLLSNNSSQIHTSVETMEQEEVEELDKSVYPGGHLTVLFGSQTGTAEGFANELKREGADKGFKVRVLDLEDLSCDTSVKTKLLNKAFADESGKTRAIFLVATYGEGEATDNADAFMKLLKRKMGVPQFAGDDNAEGKDSTDLQFMSNLEYAVFGLGNRQYEHYNAMGKFFDSSLHQIGGKRIMDVGLGDDDEDLEGDFEQWKDTQLWPTLTKRYQVSNDFVESHTAEAVDGHDVNGFHAMPISPYEVEYIAELHGKDDFTPDEVSPDEISKSTKHYFHAVECPVTLSRELRASSDGGSTLHIEVDVSCKHDQVQYQTADNLAVLPLNDSALVAKVAKALKYDLDSVFRLKPSKDSKESFQHLFPTPCSIRECLTRYCDLVTPPRRSELKLLAQYAKDPLDRTALERMASKEGKVEYKNKILDNHVGIAELVARLCTSIEMPLENFVITCARLQPRFYTISSSSSVHPDTVHITVAIMKGPRKDGSEWTGVCTNHLQNIGSNGTCKVFVRGSSFRLPEDSTRPIIMIGPGTGIAPMRALLQERSHQKNVKKLNVGDNILYFGCKQRTTDYLYEDELNEFVENGTLNRLYLAFSREKKEKVYVQHLLAENSEETWDLIDKKGAYIYVCGGTKMGMDVTETILKIIAEKSGAGLIRSKAYVEELRSNSRFVQELWSA